MNPGKIIIIVMVAAGLAAGGLKVWKQSQTMHRVLRSFSPSAVELIATSPQAELWQLAEASPSDDPQSDEVVKLDGRLYRIAARRDLVGVKGFSDVRVRLVDDASYVWNETPPPREDRWNFAIRFADDQRQEVLLFAVANANEASVKLEQGGPKLVADRIADGLESFFKRQLDPGPRAEETREKS